MLNFAKNHAECGKKPKLKNGKKLKTYRVTKKQGMTKMFSKFLAKSVIQMPKITQVCQSLKTTKRLKKAITLQTQERFFIKTFSNTCDTKKHAKKKLMQAKAIKKQMLCLLK